MLLYFECSFPDQLFFEDFIITLFDLCGQKSFGSLGSLGYVLSVPFRLQDGSTMPNSHQYEYRFNQITELH
jgi:hypothetical protein